MTDFQIVEYDEFAAKLDELKDMADFLPDASTDEGYDKSKRIHLDFRKTENAIEKVRKEKKAYFIEGGKQVDSQAKALMAKIEAFRLPHTEAYQAVDQIKKEREAQRKAELEQRTAHLENLPEMMRDSCSDEIKAALDSLNNEECLDFYEFTERALKGRNKSREELAKMYSSALKDEKEAEELERLRKEEAERKQKEHEERIKREAKEAAEAKQREAEEREKQAKEEAKEAARKAEEIERLRKEEAERMAKELELEKERQAKIAKEAAEQARLAEIKRQEDEARKEAEAQAKREANNKHIGKIRKEAKECLMTLDISEEKAKEIIMAIHSGNIKNVSINY